MSAPIPLIAPPATTAAQGMISPLNPFVDQAGALTPVNFRFLSDLYSKVRMTPYAVATLPKTVRAGTRAFVTDASAPTFLGTLTGGGTVTCPVFFNGTHWVAG